MKQYLRSRVSMISSYIEIYISVLILIGLLLISATLIYDLILFSKSILNGTLNFDYDHFLGYGLQLIIGVEFVKMLAKHTPGSAIEVLLFATARKLIVDHELSGIELILGIIGIAILFATKKFLYSSDFTNQGGFILSGGTSISEVNSIASVKIPEELANTIGGLVSIKLKEIGKKPLEGRCVIVDNVKLRIYHIRDEIIDKVEIIPVKKRNFF